LLLVTLLAKKFAVKKIHWILLIVSVVIIALHLFFDPFDEWFLD